MTQDNNTDGDEMNDITELFSHMSERERAELLRKKERVKIGEHRLQATFRHLWGSVYGITRPGSEEFRITADEVEDLADYIGEDQETKP